MRQTKPKILNAQFIFWQRFNMPFFISKTFPVTDVYYVIVCRCDISYILWRRGVVVITTAQLHSSKSELRFCAGSLCVGDSWWRGSLTMVPTGNEAKRLSSVNHTTKTIHHHHISQTLHWGSYIYDVHTEGGWGSLDICHVFADSIVFKQ